MKEINLWDKFNDSYQIISNWDEFLSYIKNNSISILSFSFNDEYQPGNDINGVIDNFCMTNQLKVIHTDENHPVAIAKNHRNIYVDYMNSHFYQEHKSELIQMMRQEIMNSNIKSISIYPDVMNDELFQYIIHKKDLYGVTFYDCEPSEEQLKTMKEQHMNIYLSKKGKTEQINSNQLLERYTFQDAETLQKVSIENSTPLIENIKYLKPDCSIIVGGFSMQEEDKYHVLKDVLRVIQENHLNNPVEVDVESRIKLRESGALQHIDENTHLTIHNDAYDYSLKEYLDEENKLDQLVKPIQESKMSPLEKYMAVYDIVKNYKPYKENPKQLEESRYLRYILNNDYMVCVGYAKLLTTLLERVGIESTDYSTSVDTSYDHGYTKEDKPVTLAGHARAMIHIDDDKYHVHGYYIADPTWDNNKKNNSIVYSLCNYDSMQESARLFKLERLDLLFDVHNEKEFYEKINVLIKKLNDDGKAYWHVYDFIMSAMESIDKTTYQSLFERYDSTFQDLYNKINSVNSTIMKDRKLMNLTDESFQNIDENDYFGMQLKKEYEKRKSEPLESKQKRALAVHNQAVELQGLLNHFYQQFIHDICQIMLKYSNQKIDGKKLIDAEMQSRILLGYVKKDQEKDVRDELIVSNEIRNMSSFPYQMDDEQVWNTNASLRF